MRDAMLLEGRTALVTGAARGIGRAIARALAAEGAAVALADVQNSVRNAADALSADGFRVAAAVFDVSDSEAVRTGVDAIQAQIGDVDVLVNNAGIVNNIAPIDRMTPQAWNRELAVNLGGQLYTIQAVIGGMVEKRWGRIINVSSGADRGGLHRQVAYAASKAGVIGLTHTVVLEYARHGITCNAILPGIIATELVTAMPEAIQHNALASTPARRFGTIEEVGALVAFLASDAAGFINGAEIDIDGGLRLNTSSLASRKEVTR
jgi:NAD(P)-dependent dehydrogenase (short-subunit alcohol dehydrogenase family)